MSAFLSSLQRFSSALWMTVRSPWDGLVAYVTLHPGIAPIIGSMITALISAIVLFWIASRYTMRMKQVDASLEFSKRFHDLIEQLRTLNRSYELKRQDNKDGLQTETDVNDANAWWWRFFDLQLYQLDFFHQRFLRAGRFLEWMTWRWYDHRNNTMSCCGMDYRKGWQYWKDNPALGNNRLAVFLDRIHGAAEPEGVRKIVEQSAPRRGILFRRKIRSDLT
jgi:hypothetical protein